MFSSGIMPPVAVYESCIEFTAPVEVRVVTAAYSAEPTMPNRCSLPSIAPPASCGAVPCPATSSALTAAIDAIARVDMTARIA
jgi:hypothetical protein